MRYNRSEEDKATKKGSPIFYFDFLFLLGSFFMVRPVSAVVQNEGLFNPVPREIVQVILSTLDAKGWVNASEVNQRWKDVSRNPDLLYQAGITSLKKKNFQEALVYFRAGATVSDPRSMFELLLMHTYKQLDDSNPFTEELAGLYKAAEKTGDALAKNNLAYIYLHGLGVNKDPVEAFRLYQESAEMGNSYGLLNLGWFYWKGVVVPKDLREALRLFILSGHKGNPNAAIHLGQCYEGDYEEDLGGEAIPKDLTLAERWFLQAAQAGDSRAQCCLGYHYQHRNQDNQSSEKAAYWYRKSAEQGERAGQLNLAYMYEHGLGVEKSLKEAVRWYQKASDQGSLCAFYELCRLDPSSGIRTELSQQE